MHNPSSWYDTPLGQFFGGERHRREEASGEFVTEEGTRPRIDPYLRGLASALTVSAGRVPRIP
jgi:hypothetical protein